MTKFVLKDKADIVPIRIPTSPFMIISNKKTVEHFLDYFTLFSENGVADGPCPTERLQLHPFRKMNPTIPYWVRLARKIVLQFLGKQLAWSFHP